MVLPDGGGVVVNVEGVVRGVLAGGREREVEAAGGEGRRQDESYVGDRHRDGQRRAQVEGTKVFPVRASCNEGL